MIPKTYIALLRAVNVGGKNLLSMAGLRKHLESQGFASVSTYLQSGNVIFQSSNTNEKELEILLKQTIYQAFNLQIEVFVKPADVLADLICNNPFKSLTQLESDKIAVSFLSEIPDVESIVKLQQFNCLSDEYYIYRDFVFLYCPHGFGRAKLTNHVLESKLKLKSTARNWKTIQALSKICSAE
jgi:uncharacterized protein (DUF1697 family)